MTPQPGAPTTLGDLLVELDTLDDAATIYAAEPWTVQSRAVVVRGHGDDASSDRDGLRYLLEVELVREVAEVWAAWRGGRVPTVRELCRAVVHYSTHGAWQPVAPWSREEFASTVEQARSVHPDWFDLPPDRPPSPADVGRVEEQLGCRLPADYVWFVQQYGGGDFAFARFRSLDPDSDLFILRRHEPGSDRVVIGDDGTGLEFCFGVVNGACADRVLVVDTDDGATQDNGSTFLEFAVRQALR